MSGPLKAGDTEAEPVVDGSDGVPVLHRYPSRVTEVGGIQVRRALPKREHRTIGAWCFVDHFGPTAPGEVVMEVGSHPHMGLQTVTWLVEGQALHRDSLGSEQVIRPGQLNVMTAGRGVAHAEQSDRSTSVLHGVQLWVAQPDTTRNGEPAFEHHGELPEMQFGSASATLLVGELGGHVSPARSDTPLLGAAMSSVSSGSSVVPLNRAHEYGIVVLAGRIAIGDDIIGPGELTYLGTGRQELTILTENDAEWLLLGGEPFQEPIFMWWNFVGRSRDEMDVARRAWQEHGERFGEVATPLQRIDAPATYWRRSES